MANKNAKRKKSVLMLTLITVLSFLIFGLTIIGSFAAYTNSQHAQRTVAPYGTGERFSSNYLKKGYGKDNMVTAYVTDAASQIPTKTVTVCNYESGTQSKPFPEEITYTLTVRFVKFDDSTQEKYVAADAGDISGYKATLTKVGATPVSKVIDSSAASKSFSGTLNSTDPMKGVSDTYILTFKDVTTEPHTGSNFAANQPNLYVEITVTPNRGLSTLCGVFKTAVRAEGASNAWTGAFKQEAANPSGIDGYNYNYNISGWGAGTVTLTWVDTKVKLRDDSLLILRAIKTAETSNSITFSVDSDVASSYDLVFYNVNVTTETWEQMNSTVVTFAFSVS